MAEIRKIENGVIVTREDSEVNSCCLEKNISGEYFFHIRTKDFEVKFNNDETTHFFESRIKQFERENGDDDDDDDGHLPCLECGDPVPLFEHKDNDGLCHVCNF